MLSELQFPIGVSQRNDPPSTRIDRNDNILKYRHDFFNLYNIIFYPLSFYY